MQAGAPKDFQGGPPSPILVKMGSAHARTAEVSCSGWQRALVVCGDQPISCLPGQSHSHQMLDTTLDLLSYLQAERWPSD